MGDSMKSWWQLPSQMSRTQIKLRVGKWHTWCRDLIRTHVLGSPGTHGNCSCLVSLDSQRSFCVWKLRDPLWQLCAHLLPCLAWHAQAFVCLKWLLPEWSRKRPFVPLYGGLWRGEQGAGWGIPCLWLLTHSKEQFSPCVIKLLIEHHPAICCFNFSIPSVSLSRLYLLIFPQAAGWIALATPQKRDVDWSFFAE